MEKLGEENPILGRIARSMGQKALSFSREKYPDLEPRLHSMGQRVLEFCAEGVLLETPFDYPPDFEEMVKDRVREGNYCFVMAGSHKAQPAGLPLVELSNKLARIWNSLRPDDSQIKGSLLLIAKTLEGGQGEEITSGFSMTKPILDKNNVQTLPIIRKKDEKYFSKEEIEESRRQSRIETGKIVEAGRIPIILPEGVVESGRQKPGGAPGEINGMMPLEPRAMANLLTRIRRQGKEPLIFFVGTTGENRIYDPITEKITSEAYMTAAVRSIPLVGKRLKKPIMRSVVDYPISLAELEERYGEKGRLSAEALDWVSGNSLARLLPPHERGAFSNSDFDAAAGQRETDSLFR